MKGRTTFVELANIPYNIFHTLYYQAWKQRIAEAAAMEKEKSENNANSSQDVSAPPPIAMREALEELVDG